MDRPQDLPQPRVDNASQVRCPECGQPATVIDRFILYRSTGPVLHLRTACTAREHFDRSM
jgi:hypothetical protein